MRSPNPVPAAGYSGAMPAYYLGRPADVWLRALRLPRSRRRQPADARRLRAALDR